MNQFKEFDIQPVVGYYPDGSDTLTFYAAQTLEEAGEMAEKTGGTVCWGAYGRDAEGLVHHIADRDSYQLAANLVTSLTGISLPLESASKVVIQNPSVSMQSIVDDAIEQFEQMERMFQDDAEFMSVLDRMRQLRDGPKVQTEDDWLNSPPHKSSASSPGR